jgi:hypothetical protein
VYKNGGGFGTYRVADCHNVNVNVALATAAPPAPAVLYVAPDCPGVPEIIEPSVMAGLLGSVMSDAVIVMPATSAPLDMLLPSVSMPVVTAIVQDVAVIAITCRTC